MQGNPSFWHHMITAKLGSSYCKSLHNASTWRGISLIRCVSLSDNHTEATQIESPPAFLQHKDHCLANCSPQICFLPLTNTSWRHKKIKDPWVHLLLLVNHSWWRSMKWSMPSPPKETLVAPTHVKQKRSLNIFPLPVRMTPWQFNWKSVKPQPAIFNRRSIPTSLYTGLYYIVTPLSGG